MISWSRLNVKGGQGVTQHARAATDGFGRAAPLSEDGPAARGAKRLGNLVACLLAAALWGCAGAAPKPAVVELEVQPAADLNPDPNGRPSPVVMRLYHLASNTAFGSVDFLQLYENEAATLGPDLLAREEVVLLPGQAQTLVRELSPDARFLGVAVFYRKFDGAQWHAVAPVPPNQTTKLDALVGALSVSLVPDESES